MPMHDLLAWLVGGGSLLYFLVAMLKPGWFLYIPPKQRQAQTKPMHLLSMDGPANEKKQALLMKGHYVKS